MLDRTSETENNAPAGEAEFTGDAAALPAKRKWWRVVFDFWAARSAAAMASFRASLTTTAEGFAFAWHILRLSLIHI